MLIRCAIVFVLSFLIPALGMLPTGHGQVVFEDLKCDNRCRMRWYYDFCGLTLPGGWTGGAYDLTDCAGCTGGLSGCEKKAADANTGATCTTNGNNIWYYTDVRDPLCDCTTRSEVESGPNTAVNAPQGLARKTCG